jgi:hypothetical protein
MFPICAVNTRVMRARKSPAPLKPKGVALAFAKATTGKPTEKDCSCYTQSPLRVVRVGSSSGDKFR